jgi:purine-binding chemotaxis protein CheW
MKNNLSTLRSRRFAARQQEATQQIIAFQLLDFWFALPILAIEKVITLDKINNNQDHRKLLLIDTTKKIFDFSSAKTIKKQLNETQYIILLSNEQTIKIGLPIDSQPFMYRPKMSDFKSLSESNLNNRNFQCLSDQVVYLADKILLVLSLKKLIESRA